MNQLPTAESAIREKLSTYTDPFLGQTLGEAKALGPVAFHGGVVTVELVLGFPCAVYVPELQAALQAHAREQAAALDLKPTIAEATRPGVAPAETLAWRAK